MVHFLKRLELNGFKSFAQRTVFDFSHGITAIVGPNGSGKSNVIDAVRWLLGEREAKNLRGARAEDLIFAGTAKRPRLGQAQASLHFENSSRFFPVDFSEVTITRRVNRDGTNQYFLNKSEVRLKDLVDLLAQARLGTKGLVVVTQGNSDVFIRANPRERREMIEEMLGLREYQIKKTDAERRLKNTQVNLEKARALAEEILPHLRSLKRQTGRWERREAIERELRELEARFFGNDWRQIEEGLTEAERGIAAYKEERGEFEKEKRDAEERLKKVEASQPEEGEKLKKAKQQANALLEKRGDVQRELGRIEAQLEFKGGNGAPAAPELAALTDLVKRIKVKLELALDDPDGVEKIVNDVLEEIDRVLRGASGPKDMPEAPKEANAQFEKVKKELEGIQKELAALAAEEKRLEKGQEQFYETFKRAVTGVEAAKDKLEKWEIAHQKKLFERERFEIRRREWEHQVRQADRSPEEFQKRVAESGSAEGDRDSLERRMLRLRGDLASIGEVDEGLLKEAKETEERYAFLKRESEDLEKAKTDLKKLIGELGAKIAREFGNALAHINEEFNRFFEVMFGGGHAKLKLYVPKTKAVPESEEGTEETQADAAGENGEGTEEPEEGIEIDLRLPRKRVTSLDMLSGGERSLVGIAALFALVSVSPPPFLVLDEIDAALDERNARRFSEMLKEFSKKTQFIIVTHNRATMEIADVLYGVTMDKDDTSKVVSVKLDTHEGVSR